MREMENFLLTVNLIRNKRGEENVYCEFLAK
jgi:hypothetical protein